MHTNLYSTRSVKFLLIATLFATVSTVYAGFPFYEPFTDLSGSGGSSYTVGNPIKGNINATGDQWFGTGTTTAGTKAVVSSGSLSYPGLFASQGNSFQTHPGSGEGGRMFVSSLTSGPAAGITNQNVTVYYSLIAQLSDITALSTNGDYWIGFNNQGTINDQTGQPGIQAARLYFKKNDANTFYVGIGKNGTNTAWDTTLRNTTDVLFIVAGYQMNSAGGAGTDDNAYLWINPDSATFGQSAAPSTKNAQLIGTDADITYISSFVILDRTANCASTATFDEVRVGKTWMFVTGGPEFATASPASTNVASQTTVNLSGTAKSGSSTALSYKWQKNGANLSDSGNISGSATANLTISSVTTSDTGSYALIATDSIGSATNVTMVNITRPGASFWRGGDIANPTLWDHSTSNWFNSTTSTLDIFHDGDATVFDDTAVTNLVTVIGTNAPSAITTSNNVTPLTFTGTGVLSGPMDIEGTSSVTLALSNAPLFNIITNNAGSLIFALGGTANTISAPISDNGVGQGTIVHSGGNTLLLSANNSGYNGHFVVQSGTLKVGTATALGSSLGNTVVSNGGSLDLNGLNLSNNAVVVQGTGTGGTNGAINNSSGTTAQGAFARVTLTGDTTFNASGARWDLGTNNVTGGYFQANGFALTKTGSQAIILKDVNETGLGDIHVVAGRLGFQGNITMGDPNKTMTAESGTVLTFFSVLDGQSKNLVLNSATIDSGGVANNFYGPITLNGTCTIGLRSGFNIYSNVVGTGSVIATVNDGVGNGAAGTAVHFHGPVSFTGPMLIRTNTGVVFDAQSVPATPAIQMDIGASLDVTAITTWTLSGQTLAGSGTLAGSSVIFSSGSTLAPGPSNAVGTLTFNANPTFQSGSRTLFKLDPTGPFSDQLSGPNTVTFGGTLVLSNITASPLVSGNTFTLFTAGSFQGSYDAIVPATPGPGLAWNTNNLAINGTVSVVEVPHFTGGSVLSDGNFQLTFSAQVGQQYTLLATTNVALSLTNWVPIANGTVNSDPLTISDLTATNYPKRFYSISISQ